MRLQFEELPQLINCRLSPMTLRGALGGSGIDTRRLKPGQLFWALRGEKGDGHDFVGQALAGAAQGAVVSEAWHAAQGSRFLDKSFVIVPEPLKALQDLAQAHRRRCDIPVIALTGSNGKTSTKELMAAALSLRYQVLISEGNFNNHIGLPLTLLGLTEQTQIVILEMGTNHPGEIAVLCGMAAPTVGLVLNIGSAHLEGLGSLAQVALEKEQLYRSLPETGAAFFNLDDPNVRLMNSTAMTQICYGFEPGDFSRPCHQVLAGQALEENEDGKPGFIFQDTEFRLNWFGRHQLANALAAVSVAHYFEAPLQGMAEVFAQMPAVRGRLNVHLAGGIHILDDSYNANPESTKAALDFLATMKAPGRRIAVLGDHLELGATSEAEHRKIGRLLLDPAIHGALLIGDQMRWAWAEYSACGKMAVYYDYTEDYNDIVDVLLKILRPGDALLVKASRGMGLDRLVQRLLPRLDRKAEKAKAAE